MGRKYRKCWRREGEREENRVKKSRETAKNRNKVGTR